MHEVYKPKIEQNKEK